MALVKSRVPLQKELNAEHKYTNWLERIFNYKAFLARDDYFKAEISLLLISPSHAYFNNRERYIELGLRTKMVQWLEAQKKPYMQLFLVTLE
jgi:hypothetical protein